MSNNKIEICLAKPCISKIIDLYMSMVNILEKIGLPLILLVVRLWMAKIFWYSGLTKISSWNSTIYLFKEMYKVPVIPPEIAAYIATAFELSCPILLFLGFATRFATLPMLAMTAVIQFTYLDLIDHRYWAMLLLVILCYGAGTLSLDHLLKKKVFKR